MSRISTGNVAPQVASVCCGLIGSQVFLVQVLVQRVQDRAGIGKFGQAGASEKLRFFLFPPVLVGPVQIGISRLHGPYDMLEQVDLAQRYPKAARGVQHRLALVWREEAQRHFGVLLPVFLAEICKRGEKIDSAAVACEGDLPQDRIDAILQPLGLDLKDLPVLHVVGAALADLLLQPVYGVFVALIENGADAVQFHGIGQCVVFNHATDLPQRIKGIRVDGV